MFFFSAEDVAQGPVHAGQVFYHWAKFPAPKSPDALSEFTILGWAVFSAILSHMQTHAKTDDEKQKQLFIPDTLDFKTKKAIKDQTIKGLILQEEITILSIYAPDDRHQNMWDQPWKKHGEKQESILMVNILTPFRNEQVHWAESQKDTAQINLLDIPMSMD